MSLARYAKRRDDNEREIVDALRKFGYAVWALDKPADLLVGVRGRFVLLEVKDGAKPPSARKLSPDEHAVAETCGSRGLPYAVVLNLEEALGAIRRWA